MKRLSLLTLLFVLGAGLLIYAYADQEYAPRRGYHMGPEVGYGMGPGMHDGMGYGMGPSMGFGMWPGMMPFWDKVPEEKRQQMEQMHRSIGPAMMSKMREARDKRLNLRQALHAFPMDQNAAQAKWNDLSRVQEEAFELKLGMIAQMQNILGKSLWQEMGGGSNYRPFERPRD